MSLDLTRIAETVRHIHCSHPEEAEKRIEAYLEQVFTPLSPDQKMIHLASLRAHLNGKPSPSQPPPMENEALLRLCTLLLGGKFNPDGLTHDEIIHRLTASLNTVFDTLNQLISLIDSTFHNEREQKETIRRIIGDGLDSGGRSHSLETYLDQIKIAFLTSHQAFKNAAHDLTGRILNEFDPSKMEEQISKSFKIGPLHKAEKFEQYERTYRNCKNWYDSGRFMNDYLREFEKHCQKLPFQQRR